MLAARDAKLFFCADDEIEKRQYALQMRRHPFIGDETGLESDAERLLGLSEVMSAAGLAMRPEFIVRGDGKPDEAAERALQLVQLSPRPTAIFCYNDMSALGALNALVRNVIRVPDEISITGFDDLFFAAMLQPALTTVRQPMRQLGQRAMSLLAELLKGHEPEKMQLVQGELIVRQSTAAPRYQSI